MTSRRAFVKWGSFTGAALMLGVTRDGILVAAPVAGGGAPSFAPSQWLSIHEAGTVTIVAANAEMGQGVRTAAPMIVAEELGADWSMVHVVQARPSATFDMRTSGSSSMSDAWRTLRPMAAAAREMLVTAAAATWSVDPSDCTAERSAVIHRPSGRRLAFGALVARASVLPVPATPTLKASSEFTLLGTRAKRVDGPLIVRGTATYGIDIKLPGMRYAVIARSPRVGGAVRSFSDAKTRAMPGVLGVVRVPTGVAVIADRTWTAMRGRDALVVEWDDAKASDDGSAEYVRLLDATLDAGKSARREGGDVDAALASSASTVERTYHAPFQAHAAMEPLNCTVHLRDGRCELWVGTQAANQVQEGVARLLGIPVDRVVVNVPLLGGGFGRRLDVDYVLEAVEVARAVKSPVQVVWTREDDIRHDMYQPAQVNRFTAGLDASGGIVAWRHRVADYNLTMFGEYDPAYNPASDGDPWGGFDSPYAVPAIDVTLALNKSPLPTGAWRSVTYPAAVFARESFLDEIAHETGRDPLALRLALIPSPGIDEKDPRKRANGDRLRHVLQLAAEKAGWGTPLPAARDGRRWGRGIACNAYHRRTMVAQVAEVSVGAAGDVRVHRVVCAVDAGRVVNLSGLEAQFEGGVIWALSAALKGAMTFERGRAVQSNFHDFAVVRMNEAPVVEVHVVTSDLPPSGIGEQPVPAVAPAVMNAVYAATGRRVRGLPVRATELQV